MRQRYSIRVITMLVILPMNSCTNIIMRMTLKFADLSNTLTFQAVKIKYTVSRTLGERSSRYEKAIRISYDLLIHHILPTSQFTRIR